MVWGREKDLAGFLHTAKPYAQTLHRADPEIILQAAAFEIVTRGVESILIPEYVFIEFGQPVEKRNFRYQDMLYANGRFVNHWGGKNGSNPTSADWKRGCGFTSWLEVISTWESRPSISARWVSWTRTTPAMPTGSTCSAAFALTPVSTLADTSWFATHTRRLAVL